MIAAIAKLIIILAILLAVPFTMLTMYWAMEVAEGKTQDTLRVRLIKAVKWIW